MNLYLKSPRVLLLIYNVQVVLYLYVSGLLSIQTIIYSQIAKALMSQTRNWSPQEDTYLKILREQEQIKSWIIINQKINAKFPGRAKSPRQCREHYMNYTKFEGQCPVNSWLISQTEQLFHLYCLFGSKWKLISSTISNKSQNSVKNKFYACIRKLMRKANFLSKVLNPKRKRQIKVQSIMKVIDLPKIEAKNIEKAASAQKLRQIIIKTIVALQQGVKVEDSVVIDILNGTLGLNTICSRKGGEETSNFQNSSENSSENSSKQRQSKQETDKQLIPSQQSLSKKLDKKQVQSSKDYQRQLQEENILQDFSFPQIPNSEPSNLFFDKSPYFIPKNEPTFLEEFYRIINEDQQSIFVHDLNHLY